MLTSDLDFALARCAGRHGRRLLHVSGLFISVLDCASNSLYKQNIKYEWTLDRSLMQEIFDSVVHGKDHKFVTHSL